MIQLAMDEINYFKLNQIKFLGCIKLANKRKYFL